MYPLNYRQRLFVESYLGESGGSAVDAARRARYGRPEKHGPRLVEKRQVRAAIDTGAATAGMAASEVLARLADVASSDLLDLMAVDDRGLGRVDLKQVQRLGLSHVIKRLGINKNGTQDIELEPKALALVKLGEHYKLWKGEAQSEDSVLEWLDEIDARLQSEEQADKTGERLSETTGPVQ